METRTLIIAILISTFALSSQAQQDAEWLLNKRPDCQEWHLPDKGVGKVMRRIGSQNTAPMKAHGVQYIPLVLVEFQDMDFSVAGTQVTDDTGNVVRTIKGTSEEVNTYYQLFCNGTMDGVRYTGHGSYGSVRDYFVDMSDSAFLPIFTPIGPVTLDKGYAYYGENTYTTVNGVVKTTSHHKNINQFYKDAIAKAMEIHSDWSAFDNDGNGTVDMVFFVFAGLGESNGGDEYCIWPHESTRSITINGQSFAGYGITCEARPAAYRTDTIVSGNDTTYKRIVISTRGDGVGVFCHELSHALGLPDFYDTNDVAFGMDLWSVMDYGEYGNNGYCPGGYTAYERDFMGWQQLIELKEPCVLTIPCFTDGGGGYKIVNDANPDEYYIIENRQPKGWDVSVCGSARHGLQVTHVDFSASRWSDNTVNTDPNHQRMTIIAANNRYIGTNSARAEAATNGTTTQAEWQKTLLGNLWPGDTYNYDLTDESTPAAKVYTGGLIHKPLRNITENEDGTVTVCFRTNGRLDTPTIKNAENLEMTSFDAVWEPVEHATQYVCELYDDNELLHYDMLTETRKHYDGFLPGTLLKYRVKAMADSPEDYLDSEWSEYVSLNTLIDIIPNITNKVENDIIYDLSGRKISSQFKVHSSQLQKGIYIQSGRKVVKK